MTSRPPTLAIRAAVIGMAAMFGLTYSLTTSVIALAMAARGATDAMIGLNAGMHAVGVLLIAPLLPRLVARFNGRILVLAALGLTAAILTLLPLSPALWMWFPLRIGLGVAAEVLFVLSETWTTQFSTDANRGRSMAIYMTAMSLGFAAGPMIVSLVGSAGPAPYAIGLACTLLTLALAALPGIPRLAVDDAPPSAIGRTLALAPLGMASAALNAAVEAAGLSFLPLYAIRFGWNEHQATQLIAALLIGAIALQLPIGWLADRMNQRRLVTWLAAIAGLGALAWPLVLPNPPLAYAVVFLWGGIFVGIYTTLLTILGGRFRGTELVAVYAAMGLAWGIGALAGPLLVGVASTVTPHALPFVAAAACLAFAAFAARPPTPRPT